MKLTRLTSDDFDRLANMTNLSARARAMAQAVLVEGCPQTDVVIEEGMTRQRVNMAVDAIRLAYNKSGGMGTGWFTLELELPEPLALALRGLADSLKTCSNDQARRKASAEVVYAVETAKRNIELVGNGAESSES